MFYVSKGPAAEAEMWQQMMAVLRSVPSQNNGSLDDDITDYKFKWVPTWKNDYILWLIIYVQWFQGIYLA